jgi:hypothetical protein
METKDTKEREAAAERDRLIRRLEDQEQGTPKEERETQAYVDRLLRPQGLFAKIFKATTSTG